jgi:hypothetical protein
MTGGGEGGGGAGDRMIAQFQLLQFIFQDGGQLITPCMRRKFLCFLHTVGWIK